MKISYDKATGLMDGMTYALRNTVIHGEAFDTLTDEEITEYVTNTVRKFFVDYCNSYNIDEVEEEE